MKTAIYTPNFFLVKKGFVIKITTKTVIGRSEGDVVLEDDELLSSIHCEINPKLLEATIKDLNSTNGVYVNKQKIFPGTDFKLNVGDVVRIGSDDYVLYDNEKAVKKLNPPEDRRRHPRAENLYSFGNLLNFFSASNFFRFIYLAICLATLVSVFMNIHLEMVVPKKLEMLTKIYSDQILFSGLKLIFLVWVLSLVHSLALHLYFNRNPLRIILSLVPYFVIVFLVVDFSTGPLGGIKSYIVERQHIENFIPGKKAIVELKKIVLHQEKIAKAYAFTKDKLNLEEQKILDQDYKILQDKIVSDIGKLNKNKD